MTRVLLIVAAAAVVHALLPVAAADEPLQQPMNEPPVAVPTADIDGGTVPLRVCFDASQSYHPQAKALVFMWDFGDGRGMASEPKACHEYIQDGLYAATVTVTDAQGLKDSKAFIISVRERP